VIQVRRALAADAPSIGAVHVSAWRSAYAGILPSEYLTRLSMPRQAAQYDASIRMGDGVFVAIAAGPGARPGVVGFATVGRPRTRGLADGEIQTLYVLDDWRDRGIGRRLLAAGAAHLQAAGCQSAFLWVLRDNPSRWFYERLGGRQAAASATRVAGVPIPQVAFVWDPIDRLVAEAKPA
jgi:ribosomal protein S18 acetylase RimI-like enzyme